MLVGNKCDLEDKREVSTSEGAEFAKRHGAQFKEASAKTRMNVEDSFYDLVRSIRGMDDSDDKEKKGKDQKKRAGCVVL